MRHTITFALLCFSFFALEAKSIKGVVIKNNISCKVSNNQIEKRFHYKIRINEKAGDYLSEFDLYYDLSSSINSIKATVYNSDGDVVRRLNKKQIIDRPIVSGYSLFQDDRVIEISLKNNTYPYTIELEYVKKEFNFYQIINWYPLFYNNVLLMSAQLEIDMPKDYSIFILSNQIDSAETVYEDGRKIISWSKSVFMLPEKEVYSRKTSEVIPNVKVVPENFRYNAKGGSSSWSSFGNWIYNLNKGRDELTIREKEIIDNLTKDSKSKKESLKIMYEYLQFEKRYVSVQIGVGGYQPFNAKYVCQNDYGDCKALTNYMVAVSSYLEIESYYCLVKSGRNAGEIDEEFPSNQFNHAIYCSVIDGDTIWLECTSKKLPFNYLGTFTQGRKVLLINENNSHLVETPSLDTNNNFREVHASLIISDNGVAEIEILENVSGEYFEDINSLRDTPSEDEIKKILERFTIFNEVEDAQLVSETFSNENLEYQIAYNLKTTVGEVMGNKLIIRIPTFYYTELEEDTGRINDVFIRLPDNYSDELNISFPKGFVIKHLPESKTESTPFGAVQLSYTKKENGIIVRRSYTHIKGEFDSKDYSSIQKFYSNGISYSEAPILIEKQ